MRRDPRVDLADLLEAAQNVQVFMVGRTRDDYDDDLFLRSAVDRQFEIVGEALNRLRHDDSALAGRVPDVVKIIGFRNVLIHGYDIVDRDAVWAAVTIEVPSLIDAVTALLAELDAAAGSGSTPPDGA